MCSVLSDCVGCKYGVIFMMEVKANFIYIACFMRGNSTCFKNNILKKTLYVLDTKIKDPFTTVVSLKETTLKDPLQACFKMYIK